MKLLLYVLSTSKQFDDISNTFIIAGMPRGGTTWLAEIFNSIPNSLYLHEPLYRGRVEEFAKLNFDWHQFIPEDARWDEAKTVFDKLLQGKILNPALIEKTANLDHLLGSQNLIIKFVRLNRMLPWLINQFPQINPPVYIVRHPCAVVFSQLNHGAWNYVHQLKFPYKPRIQDDRFSEFYQIINEVNPQINSIEEHLTVSWCLDTLPLFHEYNNRKWITVSYEKAVLDKDSFIQDLFDKLNIEANDQTMNKLTQPSTSTQKINPLNSSGSAQISKWCKSLSKRQLMDIERILKKFEIDFYNVDDPEPDYERLFSNVNHSATFTSALQRCKNAE